MIQYQKTLHQGSRYVCGACNQGLPCNDCQPSCEVAEEFSAWWRSQDSHPIKWTTCKGNPYSLSAKAPLKKINRPRVVIGICRNKILGIRMSTSLVPGFTKSDACAGFRVFYDTNPKSTDRPSSNVLFKPTSKPSRPWQAPGVSHRTKRINIHISTPLDHRFPMRYIGCYMTCQPLASRQLLCVGKAVYWRGDDFPCYHESTGKTNDWQKAESSLWTTSLLATSILKLDLPLGRKLDGWGLWSYLRGLTRNCCCFPNRARTASSLGNLWWLVRLGFFPNTSTSTSVLSASSSISMLLGTAPGDLRFWERESLVNERRQFQSLDKGFECNGRQEVVEDEDGSMRVGRKRLEHPRDCARGSN